MHVHLQIIVLITQEPLGLKILMPYLSFSDNLLQDIHVKLSNKMVLEPNVSPHKQIIKDDDVKECISIE